MTSKGIVLTFGFLLSLIGCSSADDCDVFQFTRCLQDMVSLEMGDFHITNKQQMKEVCDAKQQAIQCTSQYMEDCLKKGSRDLYEATAGGKLQFIKEMCTEGSSINRGYLQHVDCWGKVKDEINFCNDKLNESYTALVKSDMDNRKKKFYGCCAFEWHRNCLDRVARAKCDANAGKFVYDVTTLLGGNTQKSECSSSYSSCYGLHGVDHEETEKTLEHITSGFKLHFINKNMLSVTLTIFLIVSL